MSARPFTEFEVASVAIVLRGMKGDASWAELRERMIVTMQRGAVDRRTESVEAIEGEARSIARFLIDQARR